MGNWSPRLKSGTDFREAASALQKSIRRCMLDDAIYWAVEFYQSGYAEYCWKRLKIMSSEDVGLGNPNAVVQVKALYELWKEMRAESSSSRSAEIFFVQAVALLALSKKSRLGDHLLCYAFRVHEKREVPDYALDKHTVAGRKMGRGMDHFFEVGAVLNKEVDLTGEDEKYRKLAWDALKRDLPADMGPEPKGKKGEQNGLFDQGGDEGGEGDAVAAFKR